MYLHIQWSNQESNCMAIMHAHGSHTLCSELPLVLKVLAYISSHSWKL